jgi:hypothetical protein
MCSDLVADSFVHSLETGDCLLCDIPATARSGKLEEDLLMHVQRSDFHSLDVSMS